MSVEYVIICDGCGAVLEGNSSAREARKVVKEQRGGVQRGKLDYCADCVKQKLDRAYP